MPDLHTTPERRAELERRMNVWLNACRGVAVGQLDDAQGEAEALMAVALPALPALLSDFKALEAECERWKRVVRDISGFPCLGSELAGDAGDECEDGPGCPACIAEAALTHQEPQDGE